MTREPSKERLLEEEAARQLRDAGFPLVQTEVPLPGLSGQRSMRADLVAWDVDDDGELKPKVLVEVKRNLTARLRRISSGSGGAEHEAPPALLRQLSGYANVLGTRESFLFDETGWYAVETGDNSIGESGCPVPSGNQLRGQWPEELAERLVLSSMWRTANELRGEPQRGALGWSTLRQMLDHLEHDVDEEAELAPLLETADGRRAVWRSVFKSGLPRLRGRESYETPWELAAAMSRLADPRDGDSVLDPFCGLGTCLWAVAERSEGLTLRGVEINRETVRLARSLARFGGRTAEIAHDDSLLGEQLKPADIVVTSPPIGLRLDEHMSLSAGGRARDADFAILDRIPDWLAPGGRAVVLTSTGVLSRGGVGERVRASLQERTRIVAVISLPAGILKPVTMIPLCLIVIERAPAAPTLVARLGNDWEDQLSESGEFLAAYRAHLRGSGT